MPGVAAAQPIVKPAALKPQKSKRSRKTPQPDLVPRRTPRHTTPSAQPITPRSSRRKTGTGLNKKAGKPSSLDPTNGAVIKLYTNLEEPDTKERESIPTVAHDANHAVGSSLVPEGKNALPSLNEVAKQPKPVKPWGNKRKKRVSIGQYSKKKPKLATSSETTGYTTPPDSKSLSLVITGPNEAAVEETSQPREAPKTPEKQTGLPNLTDMISPINAAQSPGEIRRRLIAIAQSSLRRLRLELPDEGQESEETSIQPSIEAPAPINYVPQLTVAGGASDSNGSRNLVQPQSVLPDATGTASPIATAPHEREKSTSIEQHLKKRPKLTHVIEDPEIVARPSIKGQESAVFQQAPAAEPEGGDVKEAPKSKSPAQGFGEENLHQDQPLEVPPHEDLARQDSLQEDPMREDPLQEDSLQEGPLQEAPLQEAPLHNDQPHEKPPQEVSPDEDPPREPSVENGDRNSGAALSKTMPKNKTKRKKRKAIGQQSLRRKAKQAVKPTIGPPALNPTAKPQLTYTNESSKIKFRGKAGSRKVAQIYDDDDEEEDLLSTCNYESATRLAPGLGNPRPANLEDSVLGRNVGAPGVVDKLATGKGGILIKCSDNESRNQTVFGRAKKAAIRTSKKLLLHSPSRLSQTSTRAKQNPTIKKPRGKGSLKKVPPSFDDDEFWHHPISGSDESIKPLTRRRGPPLRPTLAVELIQEDEDELMVVDRRASTKTDSFDEGEDEAEDELGGIDPIAPVREGFSGQDECYDKRSNDEDVVRIGKTANKSYQRLQSEAANPSKITKVPKPRPRAATRKPPENCIPITVYQMPSTHDLDPNTDDPTKTNNTINAVDVLAQVCREQISKSATSASEAANKESNPSEKVALELKAKSIKMYGDELDLQLFHLVSPIYPSTFSQPIFPRIPSIYQYTNQLNPIFYRPKP